jgi:hypothetical protein
MTSFDRAQQAHDANTEPPEPRPCAPDEHEPKWDTLRPGQLPGLVYVDCGNCELTSWAAVETEHLQEWD